MPLLLAHGDISLLAFVAVFHGVIGAGVASPLFVYFARQRGVRRFGIVLGYLSLVGMTLVFVTMWDAIRSDAWSYWPLFPAGVFALAGINLSSPRLNAE